MADPIIDDLDTDSGEVPIRTNTKPPEQDRREYIIPEELADAARETGTFYQISGDKNSDQTNPRDLDRPVTGSTARERGEIEGMFGTVVKDSTVNVSNPDEDGRGTTNTDEAAREADADDTVKDVAHKTETKRGGKVAETR